MAKVKFATKISDEVLQELRGYAQESYRSTSDVVDEALKAHLRMLKICPGFRSTAEKVIEQHEKTLKRLAE